MIGNWFSNRFQAPVLSVATGRRETRSRAGSWKLETGSWKLRMKARVFVTLKPSVFDPQGQTIAEALHSMGYAGIGDVRQGKYFELDVNATSADQARSLAAEVADKLLANPSI